MNIDLSTHMPNITGIIHIGAHTGEEFQFYKDHGLKNLIMIEPDPSSYSILQKYVEDTIALDGYQFETLALVASAAGPEHGTYVPLYVEDPVAADGRNGGRSSVLRPGQAFNTGRYKFIKFQKEPVMVPVIRVDSLLAEGVQHFNCLNIDVQGYELPVLEGATKILDGIDYILCEVNKTQLYEKGTLVQEIDDFLAPYGFNRVETNWIGASWGDALYIKSNSFKEEKE